MALFEPIFEALNVASVRYVVVGGLAGRPQDLIDITELQAILDARRKD